MLRALNALLIVAMLASTAALYALKYATRRLEIAVQEQERALERLESDVRILRAERAHLARPERLEALARSLGLAPIGAQQYLRLPAAGPERESPPADPAPASAAPKRARGEER